MNRKVNPERQLAELGIFVHGILTALHILGLAYNLKRRNWFDCTMHSAAAAYDVYAVGKHMRQVQALAFDAVPIQAFDAVPIQADDAMLFI